MHATPVSQTVYGDHNIFTGTGDVNIVYQLAPTEANERRLLLILLTKVKQFWIDGVLNQSVHGAALIELGKTTLPAVAIEHPWASVLELPDQTARDLPPDRGVLSVFEAAGRSLLIASEPGSGKTTTLLELGRELIVRAERDPAQPIPVVFNLSTWAEKRPAVLDWLAAELASKYSVPKRLGQGWLEGNRLTLLLDGLDEVKADYRADCVDAINGFVRDTGVPGLAVCSRLNEYTDLPVRLRLQGAIRLLPLTADQVDAALDRVGPALSGLRTALRQDAGLQALAQSPLMVSVMSLAYMDRGGDLLHENAGEPLEARRARIFETYIERMFERRGRSARPFAKERTRHWLGWLARQMELHGQSIFLFERLQPSWLESRGQLWTYAILSRLLPALALGVAEGTFYWFYIGVTFGGYRAGKRLYFGEALSVGVGVGLLFGIGAGIIDALRMRRGKPAAGGSAERESIWRTTGRVAMHWFNFVVALMLTGADPARAAFGLIWSLLFGLRGRGRNLTNDIHTVEALGWSWKGAGKGVLRGMGLGLSLTVMGVLLTMLGVQFWAPLDQTIRLDGWMIWAVRLVAWMPVFGLVGLAVGGLTGRALPTTATPNQGIRLSIRNAFFGGAVLATCAGLAIAATVVLMVLILMPEVLSAVAKNVGVPPRGWIALIALSAAALLVGAWVGLYFALFGWLIYGGMDAVEHGVLRYLLRRSGGAPRRYARFLDYAAELVFVRKVGGGYLFIHRLLMEHFARNADATSPVRRRPAFGGDAS
jgi:hypothetical protein